jgi:hypothetical protein
MRLVAAFACAVMLIRAGVLARLAASLVLAAILLLAGVPRVANAQNQQQSILRTLPFLIGVWINSGTGERIEISPNDNMMRGSGGTARGRAGVIEAGGNFTFSGEDNNRQAYTCVYYVSLQADGTTYWDRKLQEGARTCPAGAFQREVAALTLETADTLEFGGAQGGPFYPAEYSVRLGSDGFGSRWSIQDKPAWLDVSPSSGDLAYKDTVTVTFRLDPAAQRMPPATYPARIRFRNAFGSVEQTLRLVIAPQAQPLGQLLADPSDGLSLTVVQGDPSPTDSLSLRLSAQGPGFHWSMRGVPDWLEILPTQGELAANGSVQVRLTLRPAASGRPPDTYPATLVFKGPANEVERTVRLVVNERPGQLGVDPPGAVTFTVTEGTPVPVDSRSLRVSAQGPGFSWSMRGIPDWLEISPRQGELAANGSVQVRLSLRSTAAARPPDTHPATLIFKGPANEVERSVLLVVNERPGQLGVDPPGAITFTVTEGAPVPADSRSLRLSAQGAGFRWSSRGIPDWLEISPPQGELAANGSAQIRLTLRSAAATRAADTYPATLVFKGPANEVERAVRLVVNERPGQLIMLDRPDVVTFTGPQGGPFVPPDSQLMRLTAQGNGVQWSVQGNGPDWLKISPTQGALANGDSTYITLRLPDAAKLKEPNTYEDVITIAGPRNRIEQKARLLVTDPLSQYNWRPNRDIYGNDIVSTGNRPGIPGLELRTCAALCNANKSCLAFSFDRGTNRCFLKDKIETSLLDPPSMLGVKKPEDLPKASTVTASIHPLHRKRFNVQPVLRMRRFDLADCQAACADELRCVGFSFSRSVTDSENCEMFNFMDGYGYDEDAAAESGFKTQEPD